MVDLGEGVSGHGHGDLSARAIAWDVERGVTGKVGEVGCDRCPCNRLA